jgi:hypothetical protein
VVRKDLWALALLGVALAARPSVAQPFESVGVRAQGMGGAFVALADDATAVYWNPAGLAAGSLVSGVAERSSGELGQIGFDGPGGSASGGRLKLQDGSGTLVALGVPPLGLSYYRLRQAGFDGDLAADSPRGSGTLLVTDNVALTLLHSLADGVHVGTSLRAVHGSAGFGPVEGPASDPDAILDTADSLERHGSWAFDVDAGVLVARGRWRAGLTARNLVAPSFDTTIAGEEVSTSRQVRAGVAFLPREGTTLALDADLTRTDTSVGDRRQLALGAEQVIVPRVLVRGGLRLSTVDDVRPAGSVGASVGVTSSIWVDAHATSGGRHADRGWGVSLRFAY